MAATQWALAAAGTAVSRCRIEPDARARYHRSFRAAAAGRPAPARREPPRSTFRLAAPSSRFPDSRSPAARRCRPPSSRRPRLRPNPRRGSTSPRTGSRSRQEWARWWMQSTHAVGVDTGARRGAIVRRAARAGAGADRAAGAGRAEREVRAALPGAVGAVGVRCRGRRRRTTAPASRRADAPAKPPVADRRFAAASGRTCPTSRCCATATC